MKTICRLATNLLVLCLIAQTVIAKEDITSKTRTTGSETLVRVDGEKTPSLFAEILLADQQRAGVQVPLADALRKRLADEIAQRGFSAHVAELAKLTKVESVCRNQKT